MRSRQHGVGRDARSPTFRDARCTNAPAAAAIMRKPRLSVGAPGDSYEREADRVADRVMRMPEPRIQKACACGGTCRDCHHERDDDRSIGLRHRKRDQGAASAELASPLPRELAPAGGRPLAPGVRAFFERRFDADFGQVRVHTDAAAADLSRRLDASAFTYGRDIFFGRGRYQPTSAAGRRLLAHELTHVVQQRSRVQPRIQRQFEGCANLLSMPSVSLLSGSAVHQLIQAHFASTPGAMSIGIPGASAGPLRSQGLCGEETSVIRPQAIGGAAGMGFPDLARLTPGGILQVAEIKPAAWPCLIDGEEQLARYVDQGNARDAPQVAWRAGGGIRVVAPMPAQAYRPPQIAGPNYQIRTAWCTPGLLAYAVSARTAPARRRVRVGSDERVRARENLRRTAPRDVLIPAAVVGGGTVAVVAVKALWPHFWKAVIRRFAVRGAVAVALSAADGPLPFGELVAAGLAVVTVIQIINDWSDLWREADRIAATEA